MVLTSPTAHGAVAEEGDWKSGWCQFGSGWDRHNEESMHFNDVIFITGDANNMMKFSVWLHAYPWNRWHTWRFICQMSLSPEAGPATDFVPLSFTCRIHISFFSCVKYSRIVKILVASFLLSKQDTKRQVLATRPMLQLGISVRWQSLFQQCHLWAVGSAICILET